MALVAVALGACGVGSIADPYGNQYGDWYNPGEGYRWQLRLCEKQMEAQSIPASRRKSAMLCCMADHGVPVDEPQQCRNPGAAGNEGGSNAAMSLRGSRSPNALKITAASSGFYIGLAMT